MKLWHILGHALIYWALSQLSFLAVLPAAPSGPALIWLPTGYALAVMLTHSYKIFPAFALASALTGLMLGFNLTLICGLVLANTIDPLLATWILKRYLKPDINLRRTKDATLFIFTVIFLSSTVSATLGVGTLWVFNDLLTPFTTTWVIWWVSDFLGVLALTPFLLIFRTTPLPTFKREDIFESIGVGLALSLILTLVLCQLLGADSLHFIYWLFPAIIWLAFRQGPHGTTAGIISCCTITIAATAAGYGPFIGDTVDKSFIYVQSFLSVISVVGLSMMAAVYERDLAIRQRDDFFLLASHELNTPLLSLDLQTQYLRELVKKNALDIIDSEKRSKLIEINAAAVRRLIEVVQGLLEGARVATGKLSIVRSKCDLRQLVTEAIQNDLPPLLQAKVHFQEGPELLGNWDATKIQLVIHSLLDNALKYGAGKPVSVSLERANQTAKLVVEDKGIGLTKEDQAKLFKRFGRAESIESFGGLGQSLFICKAIVDAHHGSIRVESQKGQGSRFIIELPLG